MLPFVKVQGRVDSVLLDTSLHIHYTSIGVLHVGFCYVYESCYVWRVNVLDGEEEGA